jgi:hypothetical protein
MKGTQNQTKPETKGIGTPGNVLINKDREITELFAHFIDQ